MTRGLKLLLSLLAMILVASPAAADLTTSHLATDAEMLALLSDTLFVGEGRIGDGWGAATFEIDLGGDTGSPATTAQYGWPNGTAVPWTLTYDHTTNLIEFVVDGTTLMYTTPLSGFSDLFVRARAVNVDSDILVDDLVVDGETIYDASQATGNGLDILWIAGATLSDGFTISGTTRMTWTGTPPTQSRLAFQIKVGTLNPVYVAPATWGRLKNMFNKPPS
jgi:hypothetical protein